MVHVCFAYRVLSFNFFLADFVGHIKLVNEQVLNDGIVLDEGDKASTQRVLVHVQTHE